VLFLYNPLIAIAANQPSKAEWKCPVYADIHIANAQSHMQRARGTGYTARHRRPRRPFLHERPVAGACPCSHYDSLVVHPGSDASLPLRLHQHREATTSFQGRARTTDEMCMLLGSYYPIDARHRELPRPGWQPARRRLDRRRHGDPARRTLSCMQGAGNDFHAITTCMVAASPTGGRIRARTCFVV